MVTHNHKRNATVCKKKYRSVPLMLPWWELAKTVTWLSTIRLLILKQRNLLSSLILMRNAGRQQVNEEWFYSMEEVPQQAISMSIYQILLSKKIVCTVPGSRKAEAVKHTLEGVVSNLWPASILQSHPECYLYLDDASASLLANKEKISLVKFKLWGKS